MLLLYPGYEAGEEPCAVSAGQEMAEASVNPCPRVSAIFVIVLFSKIMQLISYVGGKMEVLPASGLSEWVEQDAKFRRKCDQSVFGHVEVHVHVGHPGGSSANGSWVIDSELLNKDWA